MPDASGKARIAIVGTGGIAGAHLQGYRKLLDAGYDSFEIVALCDKFEDRRAAFAKTVSEMFGWTPPQYSSVEEMAEKATLDGADICTPHAFHHTTVIPCLQAGFPVMVEKPCGITIKASDLIIDAAKKAGKFVAVAEQVRRGIKARTMRWALCEKKMIGDLRFFLVEGYSNWDFSSDAYKNAYAWQWRLLKLLTGGGMIFDAGAHFADMIRHMFGDVDEISCTLQTFQRPILDSPELGPQPMDVEDTWMACLSFASGLIGQWSWSFSAPGESVAAQLFYGSEGSARDRGGWMHPFQQGGDITFADGTKKPYEDIEKEYKAQLAPDEAARLFPHGVEEDVALECWDFVDSILSGRAPEIDAETTKRAKAICLAMYESDTAGAPVKVQDVYSGKVSAYQDPINEYWKIG